MRTPTDLNAAHAWWAKALVGQIDRRLYPAGPHCGWYAARDAKNRLRAVCYHWHQVLDFDNPAELAEPERLVCTVDGREVPSSEHDRWWSYCWKHPITRDCYHAILAKQREETTGEPTEGT